LTGIVYSTAPAAEATVAASTFFKPRALSATLRAFSTPLAPADEPSPYTAIAEIGKVLSIAFASEAFMTL